MQALRQAHRAEGGHRDAAFEAGVSGVDVRHRAPRALFKTAFRQVSSKVSRGHRRGLLYEIGTRPVDSRQAEAWLRKPNKGQGCRDSGELNS